MSRATGSVSLSLSLSSPRLSSWRRDRRYDAAMPAAKGDVVEIVNDKDAEWWLCRLRGKTGFIPASFIERVASDREAYQKSGVRSAPLSDLPRLPPWCPPPVADIWLRCGAVPRQGVPAGTRWRCERPATIRAGLDKLSKRVGRLEPGEVILSLEIVEYEGCVRVRCSRGWVGMQTRASGKVKLVQVRAALCLDQLSPPLVLA